MRKLRRAFIVTVLVWSAVVLSLQPARAQVMPDYAFLEVLDSKGKPVAEASVELPGNTGGSLKTDENGKVRFELSRNPRNFTSSLFTISKDGYFPFYDLGFTRQQSRGWEKYFQLELLKIPQTKAERKALGNEQTKREFMWAAKTGDPETVRKLLKAGISPNLNTNDLRGVPEPKGVLAIYFAVASANAETVEALLKAGVRFRRAEEPFRSLLVTYLLSDPFMWRKPKDESERREILRRYESGVETLIKAGADLTVTDYNKRNLLMLAAFYGYPRVVQTMLDRGFSPNGQSEFGETVLGMAAGGDYDNKFSKIETVNALLKAGADPNVSNPSQCSSPLVEASRRGDIPVIRALLDKGARINDSCRFAYPLTAAVKNKQTAAAKFLIEAGANINALDSDGANVLMTAAYGSDTETVRMLLDKGFPVDKLASGETTALFYAIFSAYQPNLEIIRMLLKAGADPNKIIDNNPNFETCRTPLMSAVANRNFDAVRVLLDYKADINVVCGSGVSALSVAIKRNDVGTVKFLIEMGADVKNEPVRKALRFINENRQSDYESKITDEIIKLVETAGVK